MLIRKVILLILNLSFITGNSNENNPCVHNLNIVNQVKSNFKQHFKMHEYFHLESAFPPDLHLHPFYPYFFDSNGTRNRLCQMLQIVASNNIEIIFGPDVYTMFNCSNELKMIFLLTNSSIDAYGIKFNTIDLIHAHEEFINITYKQNDIQSVYIKKDKHRIAFEVCFRTSVNEQPINTFWIFVNLNSIKENRNSIVFLKIYIILTILIQLIVNFCTWNNQKKVMKM